uniref:Protein kinase domain-containing protein n=1 Tax=Manihot esculenta TaxID=3983 RepID=A0A2C9V4Q2_MANES
MKRQFPYRQPSFFSFYTSTSMLCSATVSYSEAVKEENFTFLLEMGNYLCCCFGHEQDSSAVISFSSSELSAYTDGFSARNFLGNGGFGSVYLGTINGEQVAVKVSRRIDSKTRLQWQAEINYLANMMHQNIIKLIGYCNTPEKLYLVYPFMQHGNVKNKLLDPIVINHLTHNHCAIALNNLPLFLLNWNKTLKIIRGAARAIQELHSHSPPLVYRDLKLDNILLDKNFTPILADFGAVTPEGETLRLGTSGYTDPSIMNNGNSKL